jgi:hypothetical protein
MVGRLYPNKEVIQLLPASLTSAIHFSSSASVPIARGVFALAVVPSMTAATSLMLLQPSNATSFRIKNATPARTITASPSKTKTSHSRAASSRVNCDVKSEMKGLLRYTSGLWPDNEVR